MNVSGVGVAQAWRQFVNETPRQGARLIVVHDELELALGMVRAKPGTASPKGHNGLKSVNECLKGEPYTRIGVGIGRPESRETGDVSAYVLRNMTPLERGRIEGAVGRVEQELKRLAKGSPK